MNNLPVIAGVDITTDEQGRFNLNSLHRASGLGKSKSPNKWLENKQAKELITALESQAPNSGLGHKVIKSVHGGVSPGTFAVEQLAVAYANWISPAFYLQVINTFLDSKKGVVPTIDFSNPTQVATIILQSSEMIQKQAATIGRKDELILTSNEASIKAGEIKVGEFVKKYDSIDIGQNKMFEWMREQKILMASNEPYQRYIDNRYFTWKPSKEKCNGEYRYTPRITPRGQLWLANRYRAYLGRENLGQIDMELGK